MKKKMLGALWMSLLLSLLVLGLVRADDDDDDHGAAATSPAAVTELPTLSQTQQQAVGISTVHPQNAKLPQQLEAYGEVLDASALVADAGHLDSSRVAAQAAGRELQRLDGLYRNDSGVSLKLLEAAQAQQIESQAQAQAAASSFAMQWGPLARLGVGQRQALVDSVAAGQRLLLRADLPGRHSMGALPQSALLDVDGLSVPAKVLGVLPHAAADLQSLGLLLQIDHAPDGLAAGARVPVALLSAPQQGLLVPNSALLYGEQGAYVYRQQNAKTGDQKLQYAMVAVRLLQQQGGNWLVDGLDDDDNIVVQGAGVLWSLQGLGAVAAQDDDDD